MNISKTAYYSTRLYWGRHECSTGLLHFFFLIWELGKQQKIEGHAPFHTASSFDMERTVHMGPTFSYHVDSNMGALPPFTVGRNTACHGLHRLCSALDRIIDDRPNLPWRWVIQIREWPSLNTMSRFIYRNQRWGDQYLLRSTMCVDNPSSHSVSDCRLPLQCGW